MKKGIETNFRGFSAIKDNGILIGPWNPWLHYPKFGRPVWELVKALSWAPALPKPGARDFAVTAPQYMKTAPTAVRKWLPLRAAVGASRCSPARPS